MIPYFTTNIWIWVGLGAFFIAAGFVLFSVRGKFRFALGGIAVGLAVVLVGLAIVFFLPTDRKAIRSVIYGVADAVEKNDIDRVVSYLDSTATQTAAKAVHHMGLARIDRANVRQFNIKSVNFYTSPPTAVVAFNGSVAGHEKMFGSSFTVVVHFDEVELVKGADGNWRITNRCVFRYPGYDGR